MGLTEHRRWILANCRPVTQMRSIVKGVFHSAILILQVPKTNPTVRIRDVWLEWWSNAQCLQELAEDSMQLRRMGAVG